MTEPDRSSTAGFVHRVLRVLVVEDSDERLEILKNLFREHAWVSAHTARRAMTLIGAYDFDLISLDYDLAGPGRGDDVARHIGQSRNRATSLWVHSMNDPGTKRISHALPQAQVIPFTKLTKSNAVIKRIREQLRDGPLVDWGAVYRRAR